MYFSNFPVKRLIEREHRGCPFHQSRNSIISFSLVWFLESQAYRWASPFEGGQFVYSCVGKRVTFPFEYRLEKEEKIIFIRWTWDGVFTSETIATFTPFPELFQPSSGYIDRVTQVRNVCMIKASHQFTT